MKIVKIKGHNLYKFEKVKCGSCVANLLAELAKAAKNRVCGQMRGHTGCFGRNHILSKEKEVLMRRVLIIKNKITLKNEPKDGKCICREYRKNKIRYCIHMGKNCFSLRWSYTQIKILQKRRF